MSARFAGWTVVFLVALLMAMTTRSAVALDTAFTYQGFVQQSGEAVDGTCDVQFGLFAAVADGSPIGTDTVNSVQVSGGVFTVDLDFGDVFDGANRWLELAVRCPSGSGGFSTLTPRQQVTATPYALYASDAGAVPWSGVGGIPPEFADGTDNDSGGDITRVVAGTGMTGGGTTGDVTLNVAFDGSGGAETVAHSDHGHFGSYLPVGSSLSCSGTDKVKAIDAGTGSVTCAADEDGGGDITGVTAGTGLDGGGDTGAVNLSVEVPLALSGSTSSSLGVLRGTNSGEGAGVRGSNSGGGYGVYGQSSSGVAIMANSATGDHFVARRQICTLPGARAIGGCTWYTKFRVDNGGNVTADGTFTSPAADFAEMLPAMDGLEPGDVLVVGPNGALARCTKPHDASVVGVYSTRPGFVGGGGDDVDLRGKVPLAVLGIVPVKVSGENGMIGPGSLLVASSTPGHAMRADANPTTGTVIGKALSSLDADTGIISMLVTLQ